MKRIKKEHEPLYQRLSETLQSASRLLSMTAEVATEIDVLMCKLLNHFKGEIRPFRKPIKFYECESYSTYIVSVRMENSGQISVMAWQDKTDAHYCARWDKLKLETKIKVFESCIEEL